MLGECDNHYTTETGLFEKGVDTGANTDDLLAKVVTSNLEVTLQY